MERGTISHKPSVAMAVNTIGVLDRVKAYQTRHPLARRLRVWHYLRIATLLPDDLASTLCTFAKQDQMIGLDLEAMPLEDIAHHRLERGVVNLPLSAARATNEMVMWLRPGHLIVRLVIPSVRRDNQTKINE